MKVAINFTKPQEVLICHMLQWLGYGWECTANPEDGYALTRVAIDWDHIELLLKCLKDTKAPGPMLTKHGVTDGTGEETAHKIICATASLRMKPWKKFKPLDLTKMKPTDEIKFLPQTQQYLYHDYDKSYHPNPAFKGVKKNEQKAAQFAQMYGMGAPKLQQLFPGGHQAGKSTAMNFMVQSAAADEATKAMLAMGKAIKYPADTVIKMGGGSVLEHVGTVTGHWESDQSNMSEVPKKDFKHFGDQDLDEEL